MAFTDDRSFRIRLLAFCWLLGNLVAASAQEPLSALPREPLEIGDEPQFVFDLWTVDNHWALRSKRETVERVVHQARPFDGNPVLAHDQPSYLWVVREGGSGAFRMWYQKNVPNDRPSGGEGRAFRTVVAYAESRDGITWTRPDLDLYPGFGKGDDGEPNNVVLMGPGGHEASAPMLLDVPESDRDGFDYLMLYRSKGPGGGDVNGIRIVGSRDGIHWDKESDRRIAHLHSDCPNTICYDPRLGRYVLYCRAKDRYRAFGEELVDTGASRRIARLSSPVLRTDWMEQGLPQTILIPDEIDHERRFDFFYGMPTVHRFGVYWGFLEPFRLNDFVYTELVTSRDGVHFQRLPGRPPLVPYGPDGTWDDTMIFASPSWIEMGDEWWIYYSGWDGPHGTAERSGAVGLAKLRKEGFVSLRGPSGGGVVCTRTLRWPGGELRVNVDAVLDDAAPGELRVRVSDPRRRPLEGWNHDDCEPFRGDAIRHTLRWRGRSLDELRGREIRLEFLLRDADLYAFVAEPEGDEP